MTWINKNADVFLSTHFYSFTTTDNMMINCTYLLFAVEGQHHLFTESRLLLSTA